MIRFNTIMFDGKSLNYLRHYSGKAKFYYWQEYYLAKCIEKHFGKINIILYCQFRWNAVKHDTYTYIIIGGLNIGDFLIKLAITKV